MFGERGWLDSITMVTQGMYKKFDSKVIYWQVFLRGMWAADIQTIIQQLSKRNIGVLITDHNVRETFGIIDYGYIMNEGELLINGTPDELVENDQARKVYLGKTFSM